MGSAWPAALLLAASCVAEDWGASAVAVKFKRSETAAAPTAGAYPVDTSKFTLSGCSEDEAKMLRDAIGRAALLTATCLGVKGKGLAPDLGLVVATMLEGRLVMFSCGKKKDGADGLTTFNEYRVPQIDMAMRPPAEVDLSPAGLGGAVFHEAIHAVDHDGLFMPGSRLHNKAFPDRVYACQLACEGRAVDGMRPKVALVERSLGREIPAGPDPPGGCGSPSDCGFLKKMSYMCTRRGFDDIVPLERDLELRYLRVLCLAGKLVNGEPAPCQTKACLDLRAEYDRQTASNKKASSAWIGALYSSLYDVLTAAATRDETKLDAAGKELLKGLGEAGAIEACPRSG